MKIEQIIIENFGPFIGKQTIDLRTSDDAPLVVIYAENGRGKTFLYRAIRWALYGRVYKDNRPIPESKLVNSLGLSRGDSQMSVTLICESNGERLEVIRTLPIDEETRQPTSSKLTIVREGQTLTPGSSEDLVSTRLDEGISRFFFFDGEMLKEYETLLDDESGDVQVVRNSIEAILGAPALSRLAKALASVQSSTMKQIDASSKADSNLQKLASALSEAEDKMRGIEDDIEQTRSFASDFQKEIRVVEDQLNNFEYTREILSKIEAKNDEKNRHTEAADRARDEIRLALQNWEIGLTSVASRALAVVEPIRDKVFDSVSDREKLMNRLESIRDSATSGECAVCHQMISDDATSKLEVEIAEIQAQLLTIPAYDQSYVNQVNRVVMKARRASRVAEKATLEQQGRGLELALQSAVTLTNEIVRLEEQVGQVDQPAIKKLEERRRELNNKIAIAQAALKSSNHKLSAARTEHDKCKRDLTEENRKNLKKGIASAGSLQTPIRVNDLATFAQRAISESYDEFVQKMRESVSDSANEIFKSLISDVGYRGLMINKNFGLSLLNEEERVVDLRSSGQSQVVAVSLILSLHECAVRSGTLLMDTPFGRLDLKHRKNMMNYFTSQLPQVVLLIQSGELDDDDLTDWASFTSRRYRLERGDSTAETFVEEF
jgi:DNA sulfur modification protein DndD